MEVTYISGSLVRLDGDPAPLALGVQRVVAGGGRRPPPIQRWSTEVGVLRGRGGHRRRRRLVVTQPLLLDHLPLGQHPHTYKSITCTSTLSKDLAFIAW